MSAYIKDLKDIKDNKIYPTTVVQAVYMPDRKTSLEDEINSWKEGSSVTRFSDNGNIVKETGNKVITTSFGNDGSIVETCAYNEENGGQTVYVKRTTFGNDGSISTTKTYAGGVNNG